MISVNDRDTLRFLPNYLSCNLQCTTLIRDLPPPCLPFSPLQSWYYATTLLYIEFSSLYSALYTCLYSSFDSNFLASTGDQFVGKQEKKGKAHLQPPFAPP